VILAWADPTKDDKLEIHKTNPQLMAFQSRTGKLMQGLFGRFGQKQPPQPEVSHSNPRSKRTRSQTEIDDREFPSANSFDDDEETNWDDAEGLGDENNPLVKPKYDRVVYGQPIAPVVRQPSVNITPDLEEWAEALPAATVKSSNIQEARRGKNPAPIDQDLDSWDENIPSQAFETSTRSKLDQPHKFSLVDQSIGLWAAMIQQLRRLLPAPIRQLSDVILTAMVVAIVTVGIWIVDGLFLPGVDPSVAIQPTTVVTNQPTTFTTISPRVNPEQLLIEAIQAQFSDVTSQYPDDIIQTLKVESDKLIVQLNPTWDLISADKQDRITETMWLQARANHFRKLEVQDAQGSLIARSPVVGNHPIILQRRQVS
jgi:hypothetical protein